MVKCINKNSKLNMVIRILSCCRVASGLSGQGSFNIVKKNLLLLKNNRCNVVPQTVISPENAGIAFNILKYILELEFNHISFGECLDCWLRYLCAGGCYAVGFLVNGDINKRKVEDMCQRTKYMFKLAAYVYSGLSEEEFKNLVNLWYQCCGF